MAWTTPKTDWTTGELVTAENMNAVGENLAVLDKLRSASASFTSTEDKSIPNSSAFEDVDSENLSLTITTSGGDVLVHFDGSLSRGDCICRLDVEVDGNRQGNDTHGIAEVRSDGLHSPAVSFTHLIQNLDAGAHTFKLQARLTHRKTLWAGAQFWVREI